MRGGFDRLLGLTGFVRLEGNSLAQLRVLIAGGGTGGHIIPALAVARELVARHAAEVLFVGTARGMETRLCQPPDSICASSTWAR